MTEVEQSFGYNHHRKALFQGLLEGSAALAKAGCKTVYLDGSFVTGKPRPCDYDACWDPAGVSGDLLDPVFLDFSNGRSSQKQRFVGEFFPSSMRSGAAPFVEFFQVEKHSGKKKGILSISIAADALVLRRLG